MEHSEKKTHGENSHEIVYEPGDLIRKTYFSDDTWNLFIVIEKLNGGTYKCFNMDDGHIGPIILSSPGVRYTKVKKLA